MHTDHDHEHDHSELSDTQLRGSALETILTEKGYVDPAVLDGIIEHYETKTGSRIGARTIARAWVDPRFKAAPAGGRDEGDRLDRRPCRRSPHRSREHAGPPPHGF
jgi:hypothetical protein